MALVPSTGSESVRAVEMSVMRVLKAVELAVELATAAVFAGWVYVPDERGIVESLLGWYYMRPMGLDDGIYYGVLFLIAVLFIGRFVLWWDGDL
jgi:hypothetical protein